MENHEQDGSGSCHNDQRGKEYSRLHRLVRLIAVYAAEIDTECGQPRGIELINDRHCYWLLRITETRSDRNHIASIDLLWTKVALDGQRIEAIVTVCKGRWIRFEAITKPAAVSIRIVIEG